VTVNHRRLATRREGAPSSAEPGCILSYALGALSILNCFNVPAVRQASGFNALLRLPLSPEQLIQETKARLLAP